MPASEKMKKLRLQGEVVKGAGQVFINEAFTFLHMSGSSDSKAIREQMEGELLTMIAAGTELFRARELGLTVIDPRTGRIIGGKT